MYDYMLTKYECNLLWKLRHGAIPAGKFLYGCGYSDSPNCNYCSELDDLTHILHAADFHGCFNVIKV